MRVEEDDDDIYVPFTSSSPVANIETLSGANNPELSPTNPVDPVEDDVKPEDVLSDDDDDDDICTAFNEGIKALMVSSRLVLPYFSSSLYYYRAQFFIGQG